MDWEVCEESHYLKASSGFDTYWIIDSVWFYLQKETATPGGPIDYDLGPFDTIEQAKAAAEEDAGCE